MCPCMDGWSANLRSPYTALVFLLLFCSLQLAICNTYTTPAASVAVNYSNDQRYTDLVELQAVYDVMSATGNTWVRDIPDVCLQRWHGIECSEFSDNVFHVTSLSFGVISDDTAFPVCAPGSYIPTSIHKLTYLRNLFYYQCGRDNPLPIPREIGKLGESLESLVLRENGHTGGIPSEFANLTKLTVLDLHGNTLRGSIASWLPHSTCLQYLDVSSNRLEGPIPDGIDVLPRSLVILNLSDNRLEGSIPQQTMSHLSELEKLDLSGNRLSGPIPSSVGSLRRLALLDLSGNTLTGGIPDAVCGLISLQALLLRDNKFRAPLPSCIGDLARLQVLSLSNSELTGQAPSSLGRLSGLKALHLDGNQLTGVIPEELEGLRSLSELNMSNNKLAGPVPFSRSFVQQLGPRLLLRDNANLCSREWPRAGPGLKVQVLMGLRSCRRKNAKLPGVMVSPPLHQHRPRLSTPRSSNAITKQPTTSSASQVAGISEKVVLAMLLFLWIDA